MTTIDLVVVLIAAVLGCFGASATLSNRSVPLSWLVLAVWAGLKLIHILP